MSEWRTPFDSGMDDGDLLLLEPPGKDLAWGDQLWYRERASTFSPRDESPATMKLLREIERLEGQGIHVIDALAGGPVVKDEKVRKAVDALKKQAGNELYAELLFSVTYKKFQPAEAKGIWDELVKHKYFMSQALKRDVGVRVAALDYLSNYKRVLTNTRLLSEQELDEILMTARRDGLTGLRNHRTFQERLREEVEKAVHSKQPLCLFMIDVDHFKKHNDTHGHAIGDFVLQEAARLIRRTVRDGDIPARYGGDEFAVILPATPKKEAAVIAERIRAEAETSKFYKAEKGITITFSIGVASCPDDIDQPATLVELADAALYLSKSRGRNRVTIF